jgi:hypothetical protein
VLARRGPRRHSRDGRVVLVAEHAGEIGAEKCADLSRDRAEQLPRRDVLCNERRHPPQRCLLVRQHAQLVATCLDHALRLAQLGLDTPALGCVPSNAVHDAPLGQRPRVPLEPPHRAVGADDAGLEPNQIVTLRELRQRPARPLYVIRMEDLESGSREELRLRVAQEAQERLVHALELAVEADDGQRVDREFEELLQLGLGLRHMWRPGQVDALLSFARLSLGSAADGAAPDRY